MHTQQQLCVLGVRRWSFKDDNSKDLEGITVYYFDPSENADLTDEKGCVPRKMTADLSLFDSFSKLPGNYTFDLKLKGAAGGRTGIELSKVHLIDSKQSV